MDRAQIAVKNQSTTPVLPFYNSLHQFTLLAPSYRRYERRCDRCTRLTFNTVQDRHEKIRKGTSQTSSVFQRIFVDPAVPYAESATLCLEGWPLSDVPSEVAYDVFFGAENIGEIGETGSGLEHEAITSKLELSACPPFCPATTFSRLSP